MIEARVCKTSSEVLRETEGSLGLHRDGEKMFRLLGKCEKKKIL